jgi:hypothetical protein
MAPPWGFDCRVRIAHACHFLVGLAANTRLIGALKCEGQAVARIAGLKGLKRRTSA